ncbi:ion channel [Marinospirillum sp.]|uniref:ion channel n=1 Tax=Marinospirillum sp. TaxID=2183934 RepID=UPI0025C5B7F4|nr:ion channel [Marinospirillum sp.]
MTVIVVIMMHYEAIILLGRFMSGSGFRRRPKFIWLIMGLLTAHVAEIWLFGVVAWWMIEGYQMGSLVGYETVEFLDYIYLSTVTFTTVGFGDLAPAGIVRLLYGTESLTGFLLITWSASFTYIEMEKHWKIS